ncbi:hypothetical protein AZ09_06705 [Acetobacter aceti 1023]|nr:hypothetical protein AZ09_06705 [Acetobacter aceti 1023]
MFCQFLTNSKILLAPAIYNKFFLPESNNKTRKENNVFINELYKILYNYHKIKHNISNNKNKIQTKHIYLSIHCNNLHEFVVK